MRIITKRLIGFCIALLMVITMVPQKADIANAATAGIVYEYSTMIEDNGNIYYIQSLEGDKEQYTIYRLEVSTGVKTKIASSDNYILKMAIYNNTLYYTSSEEDKNGYLIYSVTIPSREKKTVGTGNLICADEKGIYYSVYKDEKTELYIKTYDDNKDTLVYKGNSTFSFIKSMDNTLYFTQYTESSSKVRLFSLESGKTKLTTLAVNKKKLGSTENSYPTVSDVVKVNGDIYYQYGIYQGSGNFWYGILVKIDSHTNKKSVITKKMNEDKIYHNDIKIFYEQMESNGKHNIYDTKTGKNHIYTCKVGDTETFSILGDKTYCAKPDGKDRITVSCFTSGTNKKNLSKNFIEISYKQKNNLSYSARLKKLGGYLLIPVVCTDFSTDYDWRGKCVGISWYVADLDGKLLGEFK